MENGLTEAPSPQGKELELADLVSYFENAEQNTVSSRALSETCRDYYDSNQLTEAERKVLRERGQPEVVFNMIQEAISHLAGAEEIQKMAPKGLPRLPGQEDAANAGTDALRYVRDSSDQETSFSTVWEEMLVEGVSGVEISPRPVRGGRTKIDVNIIHFDRLFFDPHSRENDFRDAGYLGYVTWMGEEEAMSRYPNAGDALASTYSGDSMSRTYGDRPGYAIWSTQGRNRRIRLATIYYKCPCARTGSMVWRWCVFTKGGKLDGGVVPYVNRDGDSMCPLIIQSAYCDRQNRRYGLVKRLISPQDEINKRRSKSLHELNSNQWMVPAGAVEDMNKFRREANRPDGVLVTHEPVIPVDRSKQLTGHMQLLQDAYAAFDSLGPKASLQGKAMDASGRSKMIDQQGGQVSIAQLLGRYRHFKARCQNLIWQIIRQYWRGEEWVRVTEADEKTKFIALNRPVTVAEDMLEKMVKDGVPSEEARTRIEQLAADPSQAQMLQSVARIENNLSDMDLDIIIDDIPDVANLQQEQFEILADLARSGVVSIPPKAIIQASSLRKKDEILKSIEGPEVDPMQQQEIQAKMQRLALELEQLQAQTAKTVAETAKIEAQSIESEANTVEKLARADTYDMEEGEITIPHMQGAGLERSIIPSQYDGIRGPASPMPSTVSL